MHCKKHSWENQQELSPNKEHQQDFPNKLLVQDQIYDKAIGSSQGQRTDTHTDNTENEDASGTQAIQTRSLKGHSF